MATTNLLNELPLSTTDRIVDAWSAAHPVTRRGTTAALFTSVLVALMGSASAALHGGLVVGGIALVLAALVDVHEHKLPNRLVAIVLMAGVLGSLGERREGGVRDCVIGALVAGGAMLAVRLCRGVGMGDVKMAAAVGASVGPLAPIAAPVAMALTATVAGGYGALARRSQLALGPSLWLGWVVVVAFAAPLGRWWA